MAKAVHYNNGNIWQQFGLDVADYTLITGQMANQFCCIKDSKDNLFVFCGADTSAGGDSGGKGKIIRISSTGVKTSATLNWNYSCYPQVKAAIHRDELHAMIETYTSNPSLSQKLYWSIPLDFANGDLISEPSEKIASADSKFAIYQDRYIWVASGTSVKIYDYTTKAELASYTIGTLTYANILVDTDNVCYVSFKSSSATFNQLVKLVYNNTPTLQPTTIIANEYPTSDFKALVLKQMLIDKYGDLIILTNSGTESTLMKYTTAGVQVGTALTLGGDYYNLNTDKDGNYYYSNALGTYKILANTAQGQAFTGVGTKIRDSGMTTYGNNITGYSPAVFS